jgi:lipid II:glycine glycyltransferase (peptidoglycan interpeptide bridge formation enzyme)
VLAQLGLRPGHEVQPRSTVLVDLTPEPDDILAGMKSKWRYNIRLAKRKGVTIRQGTRADLSAVYELMQKTAQRDEFSIHSPHYYRAAYDLFAGQSSATLDQPAATWLLAEHQGDLLSAIVIFALGHRAWYFWGASSNLRRNLMPNHLLQWEAICWARERGCRVYDLWGIPDAVGRDPSVDDDPTAWGSDGLWGVFRFKRGFGGRIERSAGAWDMVISRLGYWLYTRAITMTRRFA